MIRSDNKLLKMPYSRNQRDDFRGEINGNINKYYLNTGIDALIK